MSWITDAGPYVVGLGGLFFGWRQGSRTEGHERTLADLAATREVIEQGAIHLHHIAYALDDVKQNLVGKAEAAHEELKVLGRTYDELVERMKVRLGPEHEVTRKFVGADEAVLEAYRALEMIVLEPPADEPSAQRERHAAIDQQRQRVTAARDRFDVHRREFIDAAARTGGAKLPSR
jgi:hypothetical protein